MTIFAHLDDPISRASAAVGSSLSGLYAVASASPWETLAGALAAVLLPVAISAINRWIDKRFQNASLRAALAAAEAAVAELKAELARREAASPPTTIPFADPDRRD